MRQFLVVLLFAAIHGGAFSQLDISKIQLRLGYNLSNPHAKRVNHMIGEFNSARFPGEIDAPLPTLSFPHGIVAGLNYDFGEYLLFYGTFKNKHQLIQSQYSSNGYWRKYHFRSNTVELGANYIFSDEKSFRHYAGAGIIFGNMSVFTDWTPQKEMKGTGEMFIIDQSALIGISLAYEAQIKVDKQLMIFIRPNLQYTAGSHIRNLNDFMNPSLNEKNEVSYSSTIDDKYNVISMNGFGIDVGLVLILPEIDLGK